MNIWFISKLFKSDYLTAFINYWFAGKFLRLARKSTYDALRELTDDEELISVLCGQFGDYNLPPKRSSFFLHCCIVDHYLEGGFYPRGGTSVIAKNIIPVIEEGGGRVLVSKKVEKILIENGKAIGVLMENGVEIRAKKIISAVGVNTTYRKLLDCDLSTSLVLNKIGFSKSFMHLFVGLDKGVEEMGLRSVNIWDLPNKNYEELIDNFNKDQENSPMVSFISSPSAKDSTWSSRFPGKSTVTVIVPIKWEVFSKWDKNKNKDYLNKKEAIKTRMLETLYKHYPKTRGHVVYTSIGSPLTYNAYIGSNFGEVYGASSSKTRFKEIDFLKPYTNIENLYLTGQDILSIGYTGAMMSGFLTANICLGYNVLKLAVGIDCVKDIKGASEFFALIQTLYVFVLTTKAHIIFMKNQSELYPEKHPRQLQCLSDTRWTCRYSAINAICFTYDAVILTLQVIAGGSDHFKAVEAKGLLHQIQCFRFLLYGPMIVGHNRDQPKN